jgi:hypothetical protein
VPLRAPDKLKFGGSSRSARRPPAPHSNPAWSKKHRRVCIITRRLVPEFDLEEIMKLRTFFITLLLGVLAFHAGISQTPANPPAQAAPTKTAPAKSPAPGGAPNLVWMNSSSKVYHCYGTQYYGTTKSGKYLSEADAKAAGARPDHGKPCSK